MKQKTTIDTSERRRCMELPKQKLTKEQLGILQVIASENSEKFKGELLAKFLKENPSFMRCFAIDDYNDGIDFVFYFSDGMKFRQWSKFHEMPEELRKTLQLDCDGSPAGYFRNVPDSFSCFFKDELRLVMNMRTRLYDIAAKYEVVGDSL